LDGEKDVSSFRIEFDMTVNKNDESVFSVKSPIAKENDIERMTSRNLALS